MAGVTRGTVEDVCDSEVIFKAGFTVLDGGTFVGEIRARGEKVLL